MSLKKYIAESAQAKQQPVTGNDVNFVVNGIKTIKSTVVEHVDGKVVVELDQSQLDELAPLIGAVGGALARGAAAAGGALVRGAAKAAVGTGVKAAANKVDKALFGPSVDNDDEVATEAFDDDDEVEYMPQAGDVVRIDYPTEHEGQLGEVVEVAPSGNFAYVEFKNGDISSYHSSELVKVDDATADAYFDQDEDDDEFEESLDSVTRLAGVPKVNEAPAFDQSPGSPYDRGKSDAYYGRKGNPTKVIDHPNPSVKGERQIVKLTDPEEIKAYYAGYEGSEFGEKDYGSFPDYSDDLDEEVNIAEAQMGSYLGVRALKAPPTKQYRPAMWENMFGTVYAMDDNDKVQYFDYKHEDAIAFSGVKEPGAEPRLYRVNRNAYGKPYGVYRYGGNDDYASPTHGKLVLWIKKAEYRKAAPKGIGEGASVPFNVLVVDTNTYEKQTLTIDAVTADEAREKAEAKGYKVLKVTDSLEEMNNMRRLAGMNELKQSTIKSYGQKAMKQIDDIEDREVAGRQRPGDLATLKKRDKGLDMAAKKIDEISEPVLSRYLSKRLRQGASKKLDHVERALGKVNSMHKDWKGDPAWRGKQVKVPASHDSKIKDTWDESVEVYVKESSGDLVKLNLNDNIVFENGQWTIKLWTK